MIDKNKTYVTRHGEAVEIFQVYQPADNKPAAVTGVVTRKDGTKEPHYWDELGASFEGVTEFDLLEANITHDRTVYLALFDDGYVGSFESLLEALDYDETIVSGVKITVSFTTGVLK